MATKQWVNLPDATSAGVDRSKMTGDGVDKEDVMGRYVYIKATLDKKNANAIATLTVKPDGSNAVYETGDKSDLKAETSATAKVAADGTVKWRVKLSAAGGDKFKFAVECNGEKKDLSDEFETHRRLYYQVIGMTGVTGLTDLGFWKDEFKKNKRLIHLESTPSKGDLARSYNYNHISSEYTRLFDEAKAKYETDKDPYCFALVWVDCLAKGPERKELEKTGVSKGGSVDVPLTVGQLWKDVDKSSTAAPWLNLAAFIYEKDGSPVTFPIPDSDVSSTYDKVTINTRSLPSGVTGKIKVSVNIAEKFHGGWSFPTQNIIAIATRSWHDTGYPESKKKAILVHEAGHKVGQVPDGLGALKKQSTHDDVHDPTKSQHCNDTNCTMWWQTTYQKATFCAVCDKSVRKQLVHHSVPGLRRFF